MTRTESIALARIKMSNVTDWHVQLAHLMGCDQYGRAAEVLLNYAKDLNILAGHVAALVETNDGVVKLECQSEEAIARKEKAFLIADAVEHFKKGKDAK